MDGQLDAAIQEGGKSKNIATLLPHPDNSRHLQDPTLAKDSGSSFLWRGLC
jgi:hypothetical protein